MTENSHICTKCVLTEKTPGISFDENGVCNYCNNYVPMEVQGENKLKERLDEFRRTGKKYDCMVGISGGRDSTYTLLKLVKDYNMKVIASHYANPFTSKQAQENMKKTLYKLGVDLVTYEFPNNIHRKSTIKALKTWTNHPSSIMIPYVCTYCKLWFGKHFELARKYNVSLIVIGSNPLETASFKKTGFGGARTYHKLSNIPKIISKSFKELVSNPRYLYTINFKTVLQMYLMAGHSSPYLRWKYKGITVLRLFDYLKWNEKEVMSTIEKELDWQKASEIASYWRFDCRLDYVRRIMYAMTAGVSELRDLFGKMIREGQMTREEALERLKTEDFVSKDVVEDVLAGLGLQISSFNADLDNYFSA